MSPLAKQDLLLIRGNPHDGIAVSPSPDASHSPSRQNDNVIKSQIILQRAKRLRECHSDHIRQMIAEAAYYKAEKHGFRPERQAADWLEAEKEIMAMLFQ